MLQKICEVQEKNTRKGNMRNDTGVCSLLICFGDRNVHGRHESIKLLKISRKFFREFTGTYVSDRLTGDSVDTKLSSLSLSLLD